MTPNQLAALYALRGYSKDAIDFIRVFTDEVWTLDNIDERKRHGRKWRSLARPRSGRQNQGMHCRRLHATAHQLVLQQWHHRRVRFWSTNRRTGDVDS
jgi:hypothetical protein